MNVLSLFDGISCGQLALKRAGVRVEKAGCAVMVARSVEEVVRQVEVWIGVRYENS